MKIMKKEIPIIHHFPITAQTLFHNAYMLDSFSDLSWSLTSEINVLNWDQIVELVQCVVAVSALVLAGIVLVADDVSLVGVLNDGLLVPLGAAIGQKIDMIVQVVNEIVLKISECI